LQRDQDCLRLEAAVPIRAAASMSVGNLGDAPIAAELRYSHDRHEVRLLPADVGSNLDVARSPPSWKRAWCPMIEAGAHGLWVSTAPGGLIYVEAECADAVPAGLCSQRAAFVMAHAEAGGRSGLGTVPSLSPMAA